MSTARLGPNNWSISYNTSIVYSLSNVTIGETTENARLENVEPRTEVRGEQEKSSIDRPCNAKSGSQYRRQAEKVRG